MNPIIWLMIVVVLVIIEAMTFGLTTIWFAGGALCAAVMSYLKYGIYPQLAVFFGASFFLLVVTRPLAVRFMKKGMPKTNVNSMIGRTAKVIERIDNLAQTGRVRVNDIEWKAQSVEDGKTIETGTIVEVKEVRGVRLIVDIAKTE
ncbi:MAG: NfeD family protein [Blautia sp.]|nr:NfeD family protein [Blautia sp.]